MNSNINNETLFSAFRVLTKIFTFILCLQPFYSYGTLTLHDNQQLVSFSTSKDDSFLRPIDYTRSSMKFFFKRVFNNPNYAEQCLALNFSHPLQFFAFSSMSDQPCTYIKSIVKIFLQKIKGTPYINAHAFGQLIERFPLLIGKHCTKSADKEKNTLKECLYDFLISDFNSLKKNPEQALDELSNKIYEITQGRNADYDIPVRELQYAIKEFLEIGLNKIIWSTEDQYGVWESVKNIADQLQLLQVYNIICDTTVLDELYWSLISRFAYFLSMAEDLEPFCYEAMEKDLAQLDLPLWNLEESEELITTKADFLHQAIIGGHIRSRAYKAGMITDRIAPLYRRPSNRTSSAA